MRKKDGRDLNRREFIERSAKTMAVVVVGSTIPISITAGSCTKGDENTTSKATGGNTKKEGSSVHKQQGTNYYISSFTEIVSHRITQPCAAGC